MSRKRQSNFTSEDEQVLYIPPILLLADQLSKFSTHTARRQLSGERRVPVGARSTPGLEQHRSASLLPREFGVPARLSVPAGRETPVLLPTTRPVQLGMSPAKTAQRTAAQFFL